MVAGMSLVAQQTTVFHSIDSTLTMIAFFVFLIFIWLCVVTSRVYRTNRNLDEILQEIKFCRDHLAAMHKYYAPEEPPPLPLTLEPEPEPQRESIR